MRRDDVALTSIRRHFSTKCPLRRVLDYPKCLFCAFVLLRAFILYSMGYLLLGFYVLLRSISVISGRWDGGLEELCAMKIRRHFSTKCPLRRVLDYPKCLFCTFVLLRAFILYSIGYLLLGFYVLLRSISVISGRWDGG